MPLKEGDSCQQESGLSGARCSGMLYGEGWVAVHVLLPYSRVVTVPLLVCSSCGAKSAAL